MKLVTFPIGNDTIEVYNSLWTGVETVKFNGQVVSKHFNWFKGIHPFRVVNPDTKQTDDYRVEIRFDMSSMTTVNVDIFLNGACIFDQSGRNTAAPIFSSGTRERLQNDPYDRRVWYREAQAAERPAFREEDLV